MTLQNSQHVDFQGRKVINHQGILCKKHKLCRDADPFGASESEACVEIPDGEAIYIKKQADVGHPHGILKQPQ